MDEHTYTLHQTVNIRVCVCVYQSTLKIMKMELEVHFSTKNSKDKYTREPRKAHGTLKL